MNTPWRLRVDFLVEGHVNKQIASGLGISIKTVEKHRQQLMEKLNNHDIAGLTRFAIATGIIESGVRLEKKTNLNLLPKSQFDHIGLCEKK